MPDFFKVAWHHMLFEGDPFPHVFGRPTDCYCEPTVKGLGEDALGIEHRVITHQDMTNKMIVQAVKL